MVALAFFDVVLSSDNSTERSMMFAERFVESAIRDLDQVEQLDNGLMPIGCAFDRATVALLRGMYADWADQTESLLERVGQLQRRSGRTVGRSEELRDLHGSIRAMLSISLDNMERSRREAAEGRLTPLEEVRRELQLGVH